MRNSGENVETASKKRILPEPDNKQTLKHNVSSSLRNHRIPEDLDNKKLEKSCLNERKDRRDKSGVDTKKVIELRTHGKFDKERMKSRKVLVSLNTEHEARLVLAESYEKGTELKEGNVFPMPMLSREDAKKENLILKKGRDFINNGVLPEKLKIWNFEVFIDGKRVLLIDEDEKTD